MRDSAPELWDGVAGGDRAAEILSRLSRLFFSLRGIQRGYFVSEGASEIMNVDELLISAEELPWQEADLRLSIRAR